MTIQVLKRYNTSTGASHTESVFCVILYMNNIELIEG